MANTLTSTETAHVLLSDDSELFAGTYSIASSNPAVAFTVIGFGGSYLAVNGLSAGTATITVTRIADGATATLDVTVTATAGFTIKMGTPSPR